MRLCECGHEQQSHVDKTGECTVKDCPCDEYEEVYNNDDESVTGNAEYTHDADPFDGASGDGSLNPDIGGEG